MPFGVRIEGEEMLTYNKATSKRLLYTLFAAQSLFSAAQIAVFTLVTIVAVQLSSREDVAGLPSSVLTFSQALFAFPIAMVMGRFGRRFGLTLSYGAGTLGAAIGVLAILQGAFPLLLISASIIGMARAGSDQGRFAAGEIFPESERARMIGRLVFAGTIGAVLGPVLVAPSGRLMLSRGLPAEIGPWVAMIGFCSLAALIIFFLLRPDPMTVARAMADPQKLKSKTEPAQLARPLRTLLMLPKVQLAIVAVLISQTVMVVLMVMTPLYMHHHHHNTETISLVIAMHTLGMFGLSPLTGYLIDRFGRVPMLMVGAMTLFAAALLAPVSTNQYILAAALFLLGLGWNFGYVSGSSLLADAVQGEELTRVQGVNDTLVFMGAGFGSIAAGSLFAAGGYAAVSIAGLVLIVALVSLIFWYNRPQLRAESAS
jgi:MFS family permease